MLPRFIRRIIYFEYWPWQLFYIPLYPYLLYLSVKYRNAFAFSAINSSISEDSGLLNANKSQILKRVNSKFKPREFLLEKDNTITGDELHSIGYEFPIICKPNSGERGNKVEKVNNDSELSTYLLNRNGSIVIQEFIDLNEEYAVVFFKHPLTGLVEISSIGQKEFLKVIGDGKRNVRELLKDSKRGLMYLNIVQENYPVLMNKKIAKGESLIVEPIGNHCRGTKFINRNDLLKSQTLLDKINTVLEPLEDFHFGRIDLKTASEEALLQEEGKITFFEINGVHAEPAHIYDPNTSILRAYRDLFKQWDKIYSYGSICSKQGVPCLTLNKFVHLVYLRTK